MQLAPRTTVLPSRTVNSLDELLGLSPEHLAGVDLAEMNLLCATGLPGAEGLDIDRCLARLDEWAAKVKIETDRHLYRAHDPRWAEHYKNSENWLRAELLAQVLQEECGVHYNMERVRNIDFTKSKDLFIHGMIDDANGGTCASMPVLYAAVGRRLGYPLKLVLTKAHVFVRWDDGSERFNIETTCIGGTDSYPDDHYRTWPEKWTDAEAKANRYLVSLSPAEELASFLGNRGHCLFDNGRADEAREAYAAASRLAPLDPAYRSWLAQAEGKLPGRRQLGPEQIIAHQRDQEMGKKRVAGGGVIDPMGEAERINEINRQNMQRAMRLPPGPNKHTVPNGPGPSHGGAPGPNEPNTARLPGGPSR
ncbi:MAG: transglutaminase family protein [Phycisphaerae bacterium]